MYSKIKKILMLIMAALLLVTGSFLSLPVTVSAETAEIFYVSTDGSDAWSGQLESPNQEGTDGPFATIEKARDAIRGLKQSGGLDAPVNVVIRGGTYNLSSAIEFEAQDSGTAEFPVTYRNYPGERPVISGGKQITGFAQDTAYPQLWSVQIPEVSSGTWYFNSLFVNEKRATRARSDAPWYYISGADAAAQTFTYSGDEVQDYENLDDVLITIFTSWEVFKNRVTNVDTAAKKVTIDGATFRAAQGRRYVVENAFELLDSPGEWYLNRHTGKLYYYPKPGEDMSTSEVVAPVLTQTMVKLNGTAGQSVEYLNFVGISFYYTDPFLPHTGAFASTIYGAVYQKAAIMGSYVRNCTFAKCEIAHVGEYAMHLVDGAKSNTIAQCNIHDVGAGGIRLATIEYPADDTLLGGNVIDNNFIHDGGHVFPGGVGIWIGNCSSNNRVSHNEISNLNYSGIALGWFNSETSRGGFNNIFEYNSIHDIMRGVLSDGAGIYTLGNSRGTVIRNNLIHDVYSYSADPGGNGIYFDETSANIVAENNVCFNTMNGFFSNPGSANTVRNNIFAFTKNYGVHTGIASSSGTDVFDFNHNIIYGNNKVFSKYNTPFLFSSDNNVFWDDMGGELLFNGQSLDVWRSLGNDENSIFTDPLFENPLEYDFRLKEDSPALAAGFQQIDVSGAGLYGDTEWVSLPGRTYPAHSTTGVSPVNITVYEGNTPVLPDTVEVNYDDGSQKAVPVKWESVDPSVFEEEGNVEINGTVGFTSIEAAAYIHIVPKPDTSPIGFVTGVNTSTLRNDYTGWVGMKITVGDTPVTVTGLGRWTSPGNTGLHTVKLFNFSDNTEVAGGAAVINTLGAAEGQFKYEELAGPVTLDAGASYYLASYEKQGGDRWYDANTSFTSTDVATGDFPVYNAVDWLPDGRTWENTAFVPVSFAYIPAGPIQAPVFVKAETSAEDGSVIKLTFDKPMANPVEPAGFSVTAGPEGNAVAIEDAVINAQDRQIMELVLASPLTADTEDIKVAYTAGTVLAEDGGILASFEAQDVENRIEANPVNLVSAATGTDGNTILLTFDKKLAALPAAPAGFSVTEGTAGNPKDITAVALNAENLKIIELSLANAILTNTANVKVSYTAGTVASITGGALADFDNREVTNSVPALPDRNIVANPGFENGSAPWKAVLGTFSLDPEIKHGGAYSGKASNRTQDYDGPSQDIKAVLNQSGPGTYEVSAWTRLAAGSDPHITLYVQAIDSVNPTQFKYFTMAAGESNSTEFTKITGTVNIAFSGTLNHALLYLQTSNGNLSDLYIDDVSVTKVITAPEITAASTNADGSKIILTLDKPVAVVPEAPAGFAVTKGPNGDGIGIETARVAASDHRILELSLAEAVSEDTADLKLAYTAGEDENGKIITADGGVLGSFTAIDVTNTVTPKYTVSIGITAGGSIAANPAAAEEGSTVNLTITPDSGMRLKAGTLKYNDGTADHDIPGTSFTMPAANVTVTAEFEEIPDTITNLDKVAADKAALEIGYAPGDDADSVTQNLSLTVAGAVYGSGITWVSGNTAVVGNNGIVTRPAYENGDAAVTVTATVYNDGASDTKEFHLVVLKLPQTTCTVSFNKSGGDTEANPNTITVVSGGNAGTLPTPPTRSGYTFNGWNTEADGSGIAFTASTVIVFDITVYAQWTANNTDDEDDNSEEDAAPTPTPTPTPVPVDSSGNITAVPRLNQSTGVAEANIDAATLAAALERAAVNNGGNKLIKIAMPEVEGAEGYETTLPASALASSGANTQLEIRTGAATLILPGNMLPQANVGETSSVSLTIARANVSEIADEKARAQVGDRPLIQLSLKVDGEPYAWSNEDAPVTVTIPYTPAPQELDNAESIVIWYIDGSGNAVSVPNGRYDPATGTVTFSTTHFSYYAVGYNKVSFKDVAANAWYGKAVSFIAAREITNGTGNGNFSPEAKLTRGQYIVMVMKAYGLAPDADPRDNFADAGNTYYTGYLAAAKRLGITKGVGNNTYAPDTDITRQEMFTLLYNTLKLMGELPAGTTGKNLSAFTDVDLIASWAKDAVTWFVRTGTISGSGGRITPTGTATRAEMAQVLYNLLSK